MKNLLSESVAMDVWIPAVYGAGDVVQVLFSPCGQYLAVARKKGIEVWDLREGCVKHRVDARAPMAFTPSGKSLLASSMGSVVEGVLLKSGLTRVEMWSSHVTRPCGYYSSYGSSTAAMVVSWCDMLSGRPFARWLGHTHSLKAISTHPNPYGWVATADQEGCVKIWSVSSGQDCGVLQRYGAVPWDIQVSSCGAWVYVYDKTHTLDVWEVYSGKRVAQYDFSRSAKASVVLLNADRQSVWMWHTTGVLEKHKIGVHPVSDASDIGVVKGVASVGMSGLKKTQVVCFNNGHVEMMHDERKFFFNMPQGVSSHSKVSVSDDGAYVACVDKKNGVWVLRKREKVKK